MKFTKILLIIFVLSLNFNFSLALDSTSKIIFADITSSNQYYSAIDYYSNIGVISGYRDETNGKLYFKPDKLVNRAEAIKLALAGSTKNYVFESNLTSDVFPDVKKGDWFAKYVKTAKDKGIVKGNDKTGLFDPGSNVMKAEFLKMIILANNIDLNNYKILTNDVSNDVSKSSWYAPYFAYAKEYGIILPDAKGLLDPGKKLTRGEVVNIMYAFIKLNKGGDVQELLSKSESLIYDSLIYIYKADYNNAILTSVKAKSSADSALKIAPTDLSVYEASLIANSVMKICEGYKAWKVDNDTTLTHQKADEASTYLNDITKYTDMKNSILDIIAEQKNVE